MRYLKIFESIQFEKELNKIGEEGLASIIDLGFKFYVCEPENDGILSFTIYTEDEYGDEYAQFDITEIIDYVLEFLEFLNEKCKIIDIKANRKTFSYDEFILYDFSYNKLYEVIDISLRK